MEKYQKFLLLKDIDISHLVHNANPKH